MIMVIFFINLKIAITMTALKRFHGRKSLAHVSMKKKSYKEISKSEKAINHQQTKNQPVWEQYHWHNNVDEH